MKTKSNLIRVLFLVAWITGGTGILSAQQSGVFKSFTDFTTGKMEYGINCATESHKIKLNEFLGKDYITVIHEGKPYNLKKDEIWGYQLCDEKVVRFQGNDHFPVKEKGILWIYEKQTIVSATGKNQLSKSVTTYYYSKGGDGSILELNLLNVKGAFPENHMLHDAIDAQFKSNSVLSEFDDFHKEFKINHFLKNQNLK